MDNAANMFLGEEVEHIGAVHKTLDDYEDLMGQVWCGQLLRKHTHHGNQAAVFQGGAKHESQRLVQLHRPDRGRLIPSN